MSYYPRKISRTLGETRACVIFRGSTAFSRIIGEKRNSLPLVDNGGTQLTVDKNLI